MIKLTAKEMWDGYIALRELEEKEMPVSLGFKVRTLVKSMENHADEYKNTQNSLLMKYGVQSTDTGAFIIPKDSGETYMDELNKINSTEIEINGSKISEDEILQGVDKLKATTIIGLSVILNKKKFIIKPDKNGMEDTMNKILSNKTNEFLNKTQGSRKQGAPQNTTMPVNGGGRIGIPRPVGNKPPGNGMNNRQPISVNAPNYSNQQIQKMARNRYDTEFNAERQAINQKTRGKVQALNQQKQDLMGTWKGTVNTIDRNFKNQSNQMSNQMGNRGLGRSSFAVNKLGQVADSRNRAVMDERSNLDRERSQLDNQASLIRQQGAENRSQLIKDRSQNIQKWADEYKTQQDDRRFDADRINADYKYKQMEFNEDSRQNNRDFNYERNTNRRDYNEDKRRNNRDFGYEKNTNKRDYDENNRRYGNEFDRQGEWRQADNDYRDDRDTQEQERWTSQQGEDKRWYTQQFKKENNWRRQDKKRDNNWRRQDNKRAGNIRRQNNRRIDRDYREGVRRFDETND